MSAVPVTTTPVPGTGLNLTDATFTTLVAGGTNGISFSYNYKNMIVLKNDTGGTAVFTITLAAVAALTALGVAVSNQTISVANGKTYLVPMSTSYNVSGTVTITCDVAGKVLVLPTN